MKTLTLICMLLIISQLCVAETIAFKSGKAINARIRGCNVNNLYVWEGDTTRVIATDDIETIDSVAFERWFFEREEKSNINFYDGSANRISCYRNIYFVFC